MRTTTGNPATHHMSDLDRSFDAAIRALLGHGLDHEVTHSGPGATCSGCGQLESLAA